MKKKNKLKNRADGQRKYDCSVSGCEDKGRVIAWLSDIPITYCPKHRSYGNRVINFFLNSMYRDKLTKFLQDKRNDVFSKNNKLNLSEGSTDTLGSYVKETAGSLIELEEKLESITEIISEKDIGVAENDERDTGTDDRSSDTEDKGS